MVHQILPPSGDAQIKKTRNERLFHYILCDCGQAQPILKSKFISVLTQEGVTKDSNVENIRTKGCPYCEKNQKYYTV